MNKLRQAGTALAIFAVLFLAAAWRPARSEELAPNATKAAECRRSGFLVVVDVGHTVEVPGADSAHGVAEYTFNLQLADAIKQALVDAGFDKTVRLVTTTPPWLGLVERAERANSMHADLFISIHHDSVPDNLIETWEYEGQEHKFSDRFRGYAIFVSNDNADRKGSLQFGRLLGEQLQARSLRYTPHYTLPLMGRHRHELLDAGAGVYRYDQLIVLRDTLMPAVLLEAGSIVNRQEELELASPERRMRISSAVAAAVGDFCATRAHPDSDHGNKRPPSAHAQPQRAKATSLAHRSPSARNFQDRE
jgi:N-acetylmuramoyl-L-alanine amidase